MEIKIEVAKEELQEMNMDPFDLIDHVIETLDGSNKELVGYTVHVNNCLCS